MVGVDVGERRAFVDGQRRVAEPDIFARAGCRHGLGDDVAEAIPDIVGHRPALRFIAQLLEPVIQIRRRRPPRSPI